MSLADRLDAVNRAAGAAARWLGLGMALAEFAIVLARYVFGLASIAAQESVLYMHAAMFMIGAGWTLLIDGHVRVDVFYARLGAGGRRGVDLAGHLFLLIPSMAALAWFCWPMVRNAWAILEGPISVGGLPMVFLLKSLALVFAGLLILQSLACVLRLIAGGAR